MILALLVYSTYYLPNKKKKPVIFLLFINLHKSMFYIWSLQAQLRAFIPLMLKYSTGRGKPGWGKESTKPPWWPKHVPWANVRMDARTDEEKSKVCCFTTTKNSSGAIFGPIYFFPRSRSQIYSKIYSAAQQCPSWQRMLVTAEQFPTTALHTTLQLVFCC